MVLLSSPARSLQGELRSCKAKTGSQLPAVLSCCPNRHVICWKYWLKYWGIVSRGPSALLPARHCSATGVLLFFRFLERGGISIILEELNRFFHRYLAARFRTSRSSQNTSTNLVKFCPFLALTIQIAEDQKAVLGKPGSGTRLN